MADIEVQKRDERIKQLESVLTRALEYIEAVTVFDPPGTRGIDVAMQLGAILAKAEKPEPRQSTVCTFQFPSGKWGWVVTPSTLAGGVPQDTLDKAVAAAVAYADRQGWPAVQTVRNEQPEITSVVSGDVVEYTGGITIEKGALTFGHSKCRNLDCALCHGLPPNAGPR